MTFGIFISYSRIDYSLISPIVVLLRAALAANSRAENRWELVFQDSDSIPAGQEWERAVDRAIHRAKRVFVFWCEHSALSQQVRREYELALKLRKVVVPVLTDRTSLPSELSRINGVDLRNLHLHENTRNLFPRSERTLQVAVVELMRALES